MGVVCFTKETWMKRLLALGMGLVLLVTVSGCGSSPETIVKDHAKALNDMAASLDKMTDDASAEKEMPALEKAADRAKELSEKRKALKLSEADTKKIEGVMKEYTEAGTKMGVAGAKAMMNAPKNKDKIKAAMDKALQ
jgi:hypothetical protein